MAEYLPDLIKEIMELKMAAIKEYVDSMVSQMGKPQNPEELAGKPYEQWGPGDLQRLGQFYGQEPNTLSDFIFEKEYPALKSMEQEA